MQGTSSRSLAGRGSSSPVPWRSPLRASGSSPPRSIMTSIITLFTEEK
ncbi:unnamed protein product [Spirodela intermedia]|uniref:Uncharacterized protein n=1 Tax=Spirodela intermedia TaxID=51605 RepID=A0A7I8JUH5_SPIIN|nr:unnamed protein product [Spirodela intermedia]CAA6673744.1 unnamed protein product [Spirodela intermedia]